MSKISDSPMILVPGPLPVKSGAEIGPERRRTDRYPFTAESHVVEVRSQTRVAGRSSDLGLGGCFIDVLSPFPVGSLVRVRLERDRSVFEAGAKVCYSQQSMGMGLMFTEVKPEHQTILRTWVAELSGEPLPEPVLAPSESDLETSEPEVASPEPDAEESLTVLQLQQVLNELINLMILKKVIGQAEGKALLRKLFQ